MSMTLTNVGNKIGVTLLANGIYWQDGDATLKPPTAGQGWNSTSNLDDGLAGDTTTRENSTGTTITVLHVHNAYVIGEWAAASKYIDGQEENVYEWDGAAWDAVSIVSGQPSDHVAYTDETWTLVLTGVANSQAHMLKLVTTGASVMSISDSRPAA
jgi:hypothetical protein